MNSAIYNMIIIWINDQLNYIISQYWGQQAKQKSIKEGLLYNVLVSIKPLNLRHTQKTTLYTAFPLWQEDSFRVFNQTRPGDCFISQSDGNNEKNPSPLLSSVLWDVPKHSRLYDELWYNDILLIRNFGSIFHSVVIKYTKFVLVISIIWILWFLYGIKAGS